MTQRRVLQFTYLYIFFTHYRITCVSTAVVIKLEHPVHRATREKRGEKYERDPGTHPETRVEGERERERGGKRMQADEDGMKHRFDERLNLAMIFLNQWPAVCAGTHHSPPHFPFRPHRIPRMTQKI